jgi:hypothetical protein
MTLLACSSPFLTGESRFEWGADAVQRTARLPEIDGLEPWRCPSHDPKMPLGLLNKTE